MTRYRALIFGQPLAPSQATYELAAQSAIEADNGYREPGTGRVYLSPGVEIEGEPGEAEMTRDMPLWADALEIIRQHREMARSFADQQVGLYAHDVPVQARWVLVRRRIVQIIEAAARDAR